VDPETPSWYARTVAADAAVADIRPGARVFVGSACATPRTLLRALATRPDAPAGIELVHFLTDGANAALADATTTFRHRAWFVGADDRDRPGERLEYVPLPLTDVPAVLAAGRLEIDVAFVQVAPPDADGACSLGVSVDVTRAATLAAKRVVAEVNPAMPRTGPASTIPADRIDAFVEVEPSVIEYVHPPVGETAAQIARYVARLIGDGATLQVGLGRVPNEVLRHLDERRGLRIHSDVLTDGIVDLVERGAVSGPIIGSLAIGTERLYRFLREAPEVRLAPIEDVGGAAVLAGLPALASVTQAFAIDLSGQACTERLDGATYGGLGAQPAFHRGAAASPGGKPMVCLASRGPDGSSAVRVRLDPAEPVAIARADVHWVVTEYGTAYLHGRSVAERAIALIEIAHPDDREALLAGAIDAGILVAGQKLRSRSAYPVGEELIGELRDGRRVLVRPTMARDAGLMQDLFFRMRDEDVRTRFFRRLRSLTDEMAQHLCSVGFENEMAFAAVIGEREAERIVGSACAFVDPSTGMADVAYMVDPAWQGTGLGSLLQDRMIDFGRRRGLRGFTADVLAENAAMLHVFRRSGLRMETELDSGSFEVRLFLD
jgi:acyl-CoA hydrolase/RimJ/RimL family protein N-acetyltransferase